MSTSTRSDLIGYARGNASTGWAAEPIQNSQSYFDAWLVKVFLIMAFGLLSAGRVMGQDVRLVVNKPFNISYIESIATGPKDHIYALSSDKKLALIRFDSVFEADTFRLVHKVVKVLDLAVWFGTEKTILRVEISSVSEDGKYLALSVELQKPIKARPGGFMEWSGKGGYLYLVDFKNEVVDFKFEQGRVPFFNSGFQGSKLIFTSLGASTKVYSYSLLTGKLILERKRGNLTEKIIGGGEILHGDRFSFEPEEKFRFYDDLSQLTFSRTNDTLNIISIGKINQKIKISDSSKVVFFRLRNHFLIHGEPKENYFLVSTKTNSLKQIEGKGISSFDFSSCLLNDKSLISRYKDGFRLWNFADHKIQFCGVTKRVKKSVKGPVSIKTDALLNFKRSKRFALLHSRIGRIVQMDLQKRTFTVEKVDANFDSSSYFFPSQNSASFRLSVRSHRGDTLKSYQTSSLGVSEGPSVISPDFMLNGKKIGTIHGSLNDQKIDISRKDDFLITSSFMLYSSALFSLGKSGKKNWHSFSNSYIRLLKIDEDDRGIKTYSENQVIDLWDSKAGSKYLSVYIDTSTLDWVLFTPSGYYDCSPNGEHLIGWSVSRGIDSLPAFYPASRFRDRFNRPDVIDSALKYCSEELALKKTGLLSGKKAQKQIVQNLPPIIQLVAPAMNEFFSDTLVQLHYNVKNGTSPVHTIKVLVDGRPFRETKPERGGIVSVTLPPHDCSVGLVAISGSGESELSYSRLIWKGQKAEADPFKKASLYVLAIGISKYKLDRLRLNFASKDASDFTAVLQKQAGGGLYSKVEVKLLTDSLASRENIEDGLEWLQRQTTSRDVAMIYLAGHGENDENNRFFFLPWGGDFDRKLSTCIPHTTFKSAIEALPGKVVVFADACRSGNFFGDLTRREVDADQLSRELSSGNGGAVVFTSSSRKQASLENPAWNNGAFTKAVVEGLEGKADPYQQNYISVQSLNAYISYRVNELTGGHQKPNIIIPASMPDFAIALKK